MDVQKAFTLRYKGRINVLTTEVQVFHPVTIEEARQNTPKTWKYFAIWDTGATGSVITKKVVEDLNLEPTGVAEVNHAQGTSKTNTYLVNIALPNNVVVTGVRVTEGVLTGEAEILIGMDIIAMGDFAVTHKNEHGGTTMSFCIPSCEEIDFVPRAREDEVQKTGNRKARRAFAALKRKGKAK